MPSSLDALHLRLADFEGPLSLLLHLIERRELEVCRVSVAAVADQFLALVATAGAADLTTTGEFIAAAARLLLIKSHALLSRPVAIGDESADNDDAAVLAQQIAQYALYHEAARAMGAALESDLKTTCRPCNAVMPAGVRKQPSLSHDKLRRAALRLLATSAISRNEADDWPEVHYHSIRDSLISEVVRLRRTTFDALHAHAWHPLVVITLFLALLDTVRAGQICMAQSEPFGPIVLSAP